MPGSVTDGDAMRAIVVEIERRRGQLDVVVNAAGVSPLFADAERMEDGDWRSIIETNLTGTFLCCSAAARLMLAAGSGSIINISSVHATSGFGKLSAYAASKGGVEALTRALAVEWAPHGVRVNAIAPGYFHSDLSKPLLESRWGKHVFDQIPQGRIADPDELVESILFLAGPGSSYMTGSVLRVDGGWTAR
jgi:NAD(P)-dependent dehydrogenase (short-subunit alcohol dehydrogenase family)